MYTVTMSNRTVTKRDVSIEGDTVTIPQVIGRYRVTIKGDDFSVSGVIGVDGKVHKYNDHGIVVVKTPGGTHWAARGQRSYHGAAFEVYAFDPREVEEDEHGTKRFWARKITSFDIRKKDAR
jgi:hypothetical protein